MGYLAPTPDKSSLCVKDGLSDMEIDWRRMWRFHSDGGREFLGHLLRMFRERGLVTTDTGTYDPAANGQAEQFLGDVVRGAALLLHQAGLSVVFWDYAAEHYLEIRNRRTMKIPGKEVDMSPLHAEFIVVHGEEKAALLMDKEDPLRWPPFGCSATGYLPKPLRAS